MDYVTLRIFFIGLMAFVPQYSDPTHPEAMTVILLDARKPPLATDGCPIGRHEAGLYYRTGKIAECETPCAIVDGLCRCELDRQEVCLPWWSRDSLCHDLQNRNRCEEAFALVPRMKAVENKAERINGDCLRGDSCPGRGWYGPLFPLPAAPAGAMATTHAHAYNEPHPLVAGRLRFTVDNVGICRLSGQQIGPNGEFAATEFQFLPMTNGKLLPRESSVADIVVMETRVQKKRGEQAVVFYISSFDGNELYKVVLNPYPAGGGSRYELVLANVALDHGEEGYGRCQHSIDRDFELYHDMAANRIPLYHRPVPRENKPVRMSDPLEPELCDSALLTDFLLLFERRTSGRPACPEVTFSEPGS